MKVAVILLIASALALFSASRSMAAEMDGLMMSGGKVVIVHMGKASAPIEHEMTMSDGSTLKPNGTVLRKDGTEVHLQQGDVIMPDGHIMHGGKAAPMCH